MCVPLEHSFYSLSPSHTHWSHRLTHISFIKTVHSKMDAKKIRDGHDEDIFIANCVVVFICVIYLIPYVRCLHDCVVFLLCADHLIHFLRHVIDFCPFLFAFCWCCRIYFACVCVLNILSIQFIFVIRSISFVIRVLISTARMPNRTAHSIKFILFAI